MGRERLLALLRALDLTRLTPGEDAAQVAAFCARADTPYGAPAAVCVLPEQVRTADRVLAALGLRGAGADRVRVATVANFPLGRSPSATVVEEIDRALAAGADEIDVVLPWQDLVSGRDATVQALLDAARSRCGRATMKVILETGALTEAQIDRAADLALEAGADFLKTSTGMGPPGASLPAAARLLERIAGHSVGAGLKVSGGIRTPEAAEAYLDLAEQRMGPDWPTPERFRIGASGLFDALLEALDGAR